MAASSSALCSEPEAFFIRLHRMHLDSLKIPRGAW
jgi:hypothetical protein